MKHHHCQQHIPQQGVTEAAASMSRQQHRYLTTAAKQQQLECVSLQLVFLQEAVRLRCPGYATRLATYFNKRY